MVHKPAWFKNGQVFVSYADTVGINKDGLDLYKIDQASGQRTEVVDDKVAVDVDALLSDGSAGPTSRWVRQSDFLVAVPVYYDERESSALEALLGDADFKSFEKRKLGELVEKGLITSRAGHGSPPADMRSGDIPYIKVSDIRAGQVNINPSNLVSNAVAERFWKGPASGLLPFDLITPIRSSKNIGEFALIMPGQERAVVTKEVLIVRATELSGIDNFYLLWALSLKVVRDQWRRIVFMQTNREDVGYRYLEIEIPWPKRTSAGVAISKDFRNYYTGMEALRTKFIGALEDGGRHHVFLGKPPAAQGD